MALVRPALLTPRPAPGLAPEYEPWLSKGVAGFRPPSEASRKALEGEASLSIGAKKLPVEAGLRAAALDVSRTLALDEVQSYILLRRWVAKAGAGALEGGPGAPPGGGLAPAQRLAVAQLYWSERLHLLKATEDLLWEGERESGWLGCRWSLVAGCWLLGVSVARPWRTAGCWGTPLLRALKAARLIPGLQPAAAQPPRPALARARPQAPRAARCWMWLRARCSSCWRRARRRPLSRHCKPTWRRMPRQLAPPARWCRSAAAARWASWPLAAAAAPGEPVPAARPPRWPTAACRRRRRSAAACSTS